MATINANLTAGIDLTRVRRLTENRGVAFMGNTKGWTFDIPPRLRALLAGLPNPMAAATADVVRPWVNGLDITRRPRDMWIIDFGTDMPIEQAALYEAPFEYVREHVKPRRDGSRSTIAEWWLHERRREDMRSALYGLERYIGTPRDQSTGSSSGSRRRRCPTPAHVFARNDDYFFGVLHARPHELWSLGLGTQVREVETGFRYTPSRPSRPFPSRSLRPLGSSAMSQDAAAETRSTARGLAQPACGCP